MLFTFKIVYFKHCQLKSTSSNHKLNNTWCSGLALKFTKMHVRACGISKFSQGVIPPDPTKRREKDAWEGRRGRAWGGSRKRGNRCSDKANVSPYTAAWHWSTYNAYIIYTSIGISNFKIWACCPHLKLYILNIVSSNLQVQTTNSITLGAQVWL